MEEAKTASRTGSEKECDPRHIVKCFVRTCDSKMGSVCRKKNVLFHNFPKSQSLLLKWKKALHIYDDPADTSKVCSRHFKDEDYKCPSLHNLRMSILKQTAVPRLRLPAPSREQTRRQTRYQTRLAADVSIKATDVPIKAADVPIKAADVPIKAARVPIKAARVPIKVKVPDSDETKGQPKLFRAAAAELIEDGAPKRAKVGKAARRKKRRRKHLYFSNKYGYLLRKQRRALKAAVADETHDVHDKPQSKVGEPEKVAPRSQPVSVLRKPSREGDPTSGVFRVIEAAPERVRRPDAARVAAQTCCVPGCNTLHQPGLSRPVFSFPSDPSWQERWSKSIFGDVVKKSPSGPVPVRRATTDRVYVHRHQLKMPLAAYRALFTIPGWGRSEGAPGNGTKTVVINQRCLVKDSPMVCSAHFQDGKPTAMNPVPALNLGSKAAEDEGEEVRPAVHVDHTYALVTTATQTSGEQRSATPSAQTTDVGEAVGANQEVSTCHGRSSRRLPELLTPPRVPGLPQIVIRRGSERIPHFRQPSLVPGLPTPPDEKSPDDEIVIRRRGERIASFRQSSLVPGLPTPPDETSPDEIVIRRRGERIPHFRQSSLVPGLPTPLDETSPDEIVIRRRGERIASFRQSPLVPGLPTPPDETSPDEIVIRRRGERIARFRQSPLVPALPTPLYDEMDRRRTAERKSKPIAEEIDRRKAEHRDHTYAVESEYDDHDKSDHTYAFIISGVENSESTIWGQYSVSPLAQACYNTAGGDACTAGPSQAVTAGRNHSIVRGGTSTVGGDVSAVGPSQAVTAGRNHSIVRGGTSTAEGETTFTEDQDLFHATVKQEVEEDFDATTPLVCNPDRDRSPVVKQEPVDEVTIKREPEECGTFHFVDVSNFMNDYRADFEDLGSLDSIFATESTSATS